MLKMICRQNRHTYFADVIKSPTELNDNIFNSQYGATLTPEFKTILFSFITPIYNEFCYWYEQLPILRPTVFIRDMCFVARQIENQVKAMVASQADIDFNNINYLDLVSISYALTDTTGNNTPFQYNLAVEDAVSDTQEQSKSQSYRLSKANLYQRMQRVNWTDIWTTFAKKFRSLFYQNIQVLCCKEVEVDV